MAKELSQAAVLDFLCQAGGRVANAALLGHFQRFLRDPDASPEQLRSRRERFKGFVNSVATTARQQHQAAAGAATTYVVLRRRYRELVGEEEEPAAKAPPADPRGQAAAEPPPPPPPPSLGHGRRAQQQQQQRRRGQAGAERGAAAAIRAPGGGGGCGEAEEEEEPSATPTSTCRRSQGGRPTKRPEQQQLSGGGLPGGCAAAGRSGSRVPPGPAALVGCHGRPPEPCVESRRCRPPTELPWQVAAEEPQANGPGLAVGETVGDPQRRICEWMERAHAAAACEWAGPDPPCRRQEEEEEEAEAWSAGPRGGRCPSPPLEAAPVGLLDWPWRDPLPVFRSIRCQLSVQDLEDFLEQESPASEDDDDDSSASGASDSCRTNGGKGGSSPLAGNGLSTGPRAEGPGFGPQTRGQPAPSTKYSFLPQETPSVPERLALLSQIAQGPSAQDEQAKRQGGRPPNSRHVAGQPPPNLDAPSTLQLIPKSGHQVGIPDVEGPGPGGDGPPEQRASLVPLEPREHAWLVKVATGSWMQARALFLEDPHLATRKDFVSGFTVLHWLAKHGNAQMLQDVVTGARKAGVALDVNAKSGCGYTPLHLAAMHGHQVVVKLLVQKLRCCVRVRDCSGKRPWQYLSNATTGEVWQLLDAPKGKTIFSAHPIARKGKSPELGRKITRKSSLAAYLKPQHIKRKMASKYPTLQEREEYSD